MIIYIVYLFKFSTSNVILSTINYYHILGEEDSTKNPSQHSKTGNVKNEWKEYQENTIKKSHRLHSIPE